jgi:hypothetical protein
MFRESKQSLAQRWLSALASASILAATPLALLSSDTAFGQTDEELLEQKGEWEGRYRNLLQNAARLERNAAAARENYTRAQKRNYPRGGARQQFLIDEQQAKDELANVRQQIEDLKLRARQEGVMPGWLYEVEDEDLSVPEPAAPDDWDPEAEADEAYDREGRNPLYLEDDEDEHES